MLTLVGVPVESARMTASICGGGWGRRSPQTKASLRHFPIALGEDAAVQQDEGVPESAAGH